MELPGRRSLLLNRSSVLRHRLFRGCHLGLGARASMHEDQRAIVLRVQIHCGDELRARGTALVRVED